MKILQRLLFLVCLASTSVFAQVPESLVSNLFISLENKEWDNVTLLFEEFSMKDPENAEVFYWVRASEVEEISKKLLLTLATNNYKLARMDKALELFRHYCDKEDCSAEELLAIADILIDLGDVRLTRNLYTKVVVLEPNNLQANIFLGNYIYLQAERERKRLDSAYSKIVKPTRMNYAKYRTEMEELFDLFYTKSKHHLEVASKQIKSEEITKTLQHIASLEKIIK